jgi:hypothetical protein
MEKLNGGVITLSITVENKTADEFRELENLIRAKKKLTSKDARAIAKIIQNGYLTQCGHDSRNEKSKIAITDYELVASATPNRLI